MIVPVKYIDQYRTRAISMCLV